MPQYQSAIDDLPNAEGTKDSDLVFWLRIFIVCGLLQILIWIAWGGGIVSVGVTLLSVHAKLSPINVDINGLWLPIGTSMALIAVPTVRVFDMLRGLKTRAKQTPRIVIFGIVAFGSGILSEAYGTSIFSQYMAASGYDRCPVGDHWVGGGKGVSFINYVSRSADCKPAIP